MKKKIGIFKKAYLECKPSNWICLILATSFFIVSLYPSDESFYFLRKRNNHKFVLFVENYLRYTNTIGQVAIPFVMSDKLGMLQSLYTGITTTILTHTFKRTYNYLNLKSSIRPNHKKSNMPSGHSSMSASGMMFLIIRYGYKYAFFSIPVTLLTMWCRFELIQHTISATAAGCIIGIISAYLFTSKFRKKIIGQKPKKIT